MSVEDLNVIYNGDIEEPLQCATIGELFLESFKAGGDNVCLINGFTREEWTYRHLLTQSTKVAKALYGVGMRQNDVVAILSEGRNEFASIVFGTIFLNAIVAPTNISYTQRELDHALSITTPKIIFISALAGNSLEVIKKRSSVERIVLLDKDNVDDGKLISFKTFVQKYSNNSFDVEALVRQPVKLFDQVVTIFMSSGTTGLPKGVEISHGNLKACITYALERFKIAIKTFGKYTSLSVAPWYHAMGFMSMLMPLSTGSEAYVYLYKFDPKVYFSCIEKFEIRSLSVSPPLVMFLTKTPLLDEYDLSSIIVISCGAAPLSKELEDELRKRFNDQVFVMQAYGQTEGTLGFLFCEMGTAKPGSVGQVIKGTFAKIIDENGKTVGPNKVGELCFKGPLIMKGYRNNPEATASTIDQDGWLHTGDLGYYDDDKQFFIVDRLKELIKYKGYQVPPAELEGLLISNPKIKDAGVIGIPDEIAGELPFAFVVKEDNADLKEQEVKDFVAKNVSNPKWLRGGVKFIDEIPKNPTGKILRRELKELYKGMKSKL